jgi:hypothetical protein
VIGAAVGFAADVGDHEAQIRKMVSGGSERRVDQRLQHRAGNQMRLAVPALPRPDMQRQRMFVAFFSRGRAVGDQRSSTIRQLCVTSARRVSDST